MRHKLYVIGVGPGAPDQLTQAARSAIAAAGLVVAGYAFLSVWCADWLSENNFPALISFTAIPLITGFWMWQAWRFMKNNFPN